jgi:hypothetical protein
MKNLALFFMLACLPVAAFSQESDPPAREFGLAFANINDLGLIYRSGKNDAFWRFYLTAGSFRALNVNPPSPNNAEKQTSLSATFRVGKEKRKPLSEKLDFRLGADLFLGAGYEYEWEEDRPSIQISTFEPGFNLVLGLNFKVGKRLAVGAELLPSLGYRLEKTVVKSLNFSSSGDKSSYNSSGFNFGFSNYGALLSLVYQI